MRHASIAGQCSGVVAVMLKHKRFHTTTKTAVERFQHSNYSSFSLDIGAENLVIARASGAHKSLGAA
jgi:hypothetical protein